MGESLRAVWELERPPPARDWIFPAALPALQLPGLRLAEGRQLDSGTASLPNHVSQFFAMHINIFVSPIGSVICRALAVAQAMKQQSPGSCSELLV